MLPTTLPGIVWANGVYWHRPCVTTDGQRWGLNGQGLLVRHSRAQSDDAQPGAPLVVDGPAVSEAAVLSRASLVGAAQIRPAASASEQAAPADSSPFGGAPNGGGTVERRRARL
jgi:hypothetical protein